MGVRERAKRSATAWLAGALGAVGVAGAAEPAILEAIMQYLPERWHGIAIALTAVAFAIARLRREIMEWFDRRREDDGPGGGSFIGILLLGLMAGLIVLPMVLMSAAHAQEYTETKTISWTNPTEYEDGRPLTLEEFERFQFACQAELIDYADPPAGALVREWIATASTAREEAFGEGAYPCRLRVQALGDATGGEAIWSAWSNEVFFVVERPATRPMAPTLVGVD